MSIVTASTVNLSPELLEAILLNLSMQDILVNANRVNRTWNAAIKASPTLQQYLFFAPAVQPLANESKWLKNPLLSEKFLAWFNDIRATERYFIDVGPDADAQIVFYYSDHTGPYRKYNFWTIDGICNKTDVGVRSETYFRPEASWRHMLVMQPPINCLKILRAKSVRKRWAKERETIDAAQEGGLRMGYLYDNTIDYICEFYGFFGLQWNMFQIEEDKEAEEDGGMDDAMYRWQLIENNEEKDSVTLILHKMYRQKQRKNYKELLTQFGGKSVKEESRENK